MKTFRYRAKKNPTESVESILTAETEEEVVAKLNELGLTVVHIQEEKEAAISLVSPSVTVYRGFLGHSVTRFYKQLGRVVQSGIPLLQALRLMQEQTENTKLREMIEKIQKSVAEGHPLSQALADYPESFSSFDIALIGAGELVGRLDHALKRIAAYRENQEKLMSKVRGALAYPAFVVATGFAAIVFMLSYVMPKFSAFFLDLDQELPLLTRLLIETSQVVEKIGPFLLVFAVVLVVLLRQSLKTNGKRLGWHRFYLKLPKFGKLIIYSEFACFSRTLSLLLESGIPLMRALQASLPTVGNQVIQTELESCHRALKEGNSLGEAMCRSTIIPVFVTDLLRAGEESGRLQESLNDIADWYEQELQENVEVLTKLLEPMLILAVGAMLGLMVIAILLPIFSMNAAVS